MSDYNRRTMKLKCPFCKNTLEFHEVKFQVENDRGEKIVECNSCKDIFSIPCRNPRESRIVSGATDLKYIEYDDHTEASNYPRANQAVVFTENIFDLNHSYDLTTKQIYKCECGKCNLEELAYASFSRKWGEDLCVQIARYYSIDIKGYGYLPENAVIKINFKSSCGIENIALFHAKYTENLEKEHFRLGSIPNSKALEDTLSRTFTKKESMDVLKKLISRWSFFYEKILIISPYIEYTYAKGEKIKDTLFGIVEQFPEHKEAVIYTKTKTINEFKKSINSSFNIDYKFLKDWDLGLRAIEESQKINDSHAKMYIGISRDVSEILLGSANMANGPSLEVLHFYKLSTEQIKDRYLDSHLKEPLNFSSRLRSDVIFDENNEFQERELTKEELYSYL